MKGLTFSKKVSVERKKVAIHFRPLFIGGVPIARNFRPMLINFRPLFIGSRPIKSGTRAMLINFDLIKIGRKWISIPRVRRDMACHVRRVALQFYSYFLTLARQITRRTWQAMSLRVSSGISFLPSRFWFPAPGFSWRASGTKIPVFPFCFPASGIWFPVFPFSFPVSGKRFPASQF